MGRKRGSKNLAGERIGSNRMEARQGDIFWISPDESSVIASDYIHPYVVVRVESADKVAVCALTSNLNRAKEPANVLLEKGEANLPRQSVVVVSRMATVDRTRLGQHIGTLTQDRIAQVLAGIRFLQFMTQHHKETT